MRVGVVGIGNVLMGDDALGPYVVKLIEARYELPAGVTIAEVGTPGADLPLHLEGLDVAVVIDTVKMRGTAGELRLLDGAQLMARHPGFPATPHDPGLGEALFTLDLQGTGPREVRLVGVIPAVVEAQVGLSPAVQAAIPSVVAEILRQLSELGVAARERSAPAEPDLWWERGARPRPPRT